MKDPRFKIYEVLVGRLATSSIPVYSYIPDNTAVPFIYIGDIQLQEIQNKQQFLYSGFVNIEVFSGTNAWVGSLAPMLTRLDDVKHRLKINKSDVLDLSPDFHMITWKLDSDTGLQQYSVTEKLFVATLQFGFTIDELTEETPPTTQDVVHYGVLVDHSGDNVIHTN